MERASIDAAIATGQRQVSICRGKFRWLDLSHGMDEPGSDRPIRNDIYDQDESFWKPPQRRGVLHQAGIIRDGTPCA